MPKSSLLSLFDRDIFLFIQQHREKYYIADEAGNNILFGERPAHSLRNLSACLGGILFGVFIMFTLLSIRMMALPADYMFGPIFVLSIFSGIICGVCMAMALSQKRHVAVYADDSKSVPLFKIKQDQKVNIMASTFSVKDAVDSILARFHKNNLYVFRRQWEIYDSNGMLSFTAQEDSIMRALLGLPNATRPRDFILGVLRRSNPAYGRLRTNFIIIKDQKTYGVINLAGNGYILDLTRDIEKMIDRRVAVAFGLTLVMERR